MSSTATGVAVPKSKWVAILLAIVVGSCTWLYTYRKDHIKFYISLLPIGWFLLVFIPTLIGTLVNNERSIGSGEEWLGFIIIMGFTMPWLLGGVWIWAIVDAVIKKKEWYDNY